jgi:hypothetical protein
LHHPAPVCFHCDFADAEIAYRKSDLQPGAGS